MKNYYDFYYRMCIHGGKLEAQFIKKYFSPTAHTHAGVASNESVRLMCALSACLSLRLCTFDISNAFQNTPRYLSKNAKPIYFR